MEADVPEVMTVRVPAAARVEPPETGESHSPIPSASRRFCTVTRKEGGTVEKQIMEDPGLSTTCQHIASDGGLTRGDFSRAKEDILDLNGVDDHESQDLDALGRLCWGIACYCAGFDYGVKRGLPHVKRPDWEPLLDEGRGHAGPHSPETDPSYGNFRRRHVGYECWVVMN
jgi:hypothetical protein